MSYSYKCYSDTKDFMKKFVNAEEGAIIYGISKSRKAKRGDSASDNSEGRRETHFVARL